MAFDGTIVSAQPCRPNPPLAFHVGQRGFVASMRDARAALARSAASMHCRCIVSCSIPTAQSHAAAVWGHAELFDMLLQPTTIICMDAVPGELPTLLDLSGPN